ncbi:MAG TPA: hypothetical protein VK997_15225, partial [Deferrisomatales bacterium]|nr:hypothetical protein [Deferrisomatales bacterium]
MPHHDPTTRRSARLEEILTEELALCESLLEAGQAARAAFLAADPEAVLNTVGLRRDQLERLENLEREASTLRDQSPSAPPSLQPHTTRLRDLTREITAEETALGRLSAAALIQLRERLKGFQAGSQGLRGYRGSVTVAPRFSDRRG